MATAWRRRISVHPSVGQLVASFSNPRSPLAATKEKGREEMKKKEECRSIKTGRLFREALAAEKRRPSPFRSPLHGGGRWAKRRKGGEKIARVRSTASLLRGISSIMLGKAGGRKKKKRGGRVARLLERILHLHEGGHFLHVKMGEKKKGKKASGRRPVHVSAGIS